MASSTAWHVFKDELDELQQRCYGVGAGRVVITSVVDSVEDWAERDEVAQLELLASLKPTDCRARYRCIMLPNHAGWLQTFESLRSSIAVSDRFGADPAFEAARSVQTIVEMIDKALDLCVNAGLDLEAVEDSESDPSAAIAALHEAFTHTLALTLAVTQQSEWLMHAESSEALVLVSAHTDAVWTHLLSFDDHALGICEPYSRYGILALLDQTALRWANAGRDPSFGLSAYATPRRIERIGTGGQADDAWRKAGQRIFRQCVSWLIVIGVAMGMANLLV